MQVQRGLADYSNLKKRVDKERTELSKFASEMALLQLLPAIDNLERAVGYATDEDKKNNIVMGVVMTLQQLDDTLKSMGLVRYRVKPGDNFDPHQHEAIELVSGPKDKIIEVIEAGYTLHDKVVRPAKVKVGNGE
jgi:molecular chaperone GrpE